MATQSPREMNPNQNTRDEVLKRMLKMPPKPGSREAVLSTIGSMKDDPYLEEEVKEIYRKRRENLVEDI